MIENKILRYVSLVGLLLFIVTTTCAQENDRFYVREGNRLFRDSLFSKAEAKYRKALELNPNAARTLFNLGNAQLMQQNPKEAIKQYESAVALEKNKFCKAQMYHNMGVIMQSSQQYAAAIDCYKNALRNNPHDNMTRYNMVLCQRLLKKSPQQDQQQQNKDQEKDKNGQNEKQEKQNKENEQKQEQKKKENDRNKMSEDNAEQLLNAAKQEEKNTQDKVKRAMYSPRSRKLEKNW